MRNNRIVKNYIYNTAYQILVLVAPLITTPYVSRVLGVTNIGIYQYCQSIATYFVLIGAVGTTLYGQREIAYIQEDLEARSKAFWEIEIFRIAMALLCTIVYAGCFCTMGQYPSIYRILIVEVLATAFDISWLYMGMEDFKLIVLRNTIIKLTGIVCVFIFVRSEKDLGIYTACVTVPTLLGNISLWFRIKKHLTKTNCSFLQLMEGIRNRLKPIFVLFLPQVAMDVYLVLDKTMIGRLASDIDQVGYYSQAQKIVKLVLTIITSLGTVMLPAMSVYFTRGDHEEIVKSIRNAFRFIFMLSFALLFGLCAVAPSFVPVFFGDGYEPVVPLMIVISPILVIIAISNVVGKQYLLPTNQNRVYTVSVVAGAFVNFFLNLILIPFFNAIGASIATVLAEVAVTFVQCWHVRKELPMKECMSPLVRYLLIGGVMFACVRIVGSFFENGSILSVASMVCTGVIVYSLELILTRDPLIKQAKELLKGSFLKAS